jgi:hypothetical protein
MAWYVLLLHMCAGCAQGPYKTLQDLWDEPQPDLQSLRQQVLARYTNLDKQQPTAQLSGGEQPPDMHSIMQCLLHVLMDTCWVLRQTLLSSRVAACLWLPPCPKGELVGYNWL